MCVSTCAILDARDLLLYYNTLDTTHSTLATKSTVKGTSYSNRELIYIVKVLEKGNFQDWKKEFHTEKVLEKVE